MPDPVPTQSGTLQIALEALRWIAEHEKNEDALRERFEACGHPFHTTRPAADDRCPRCSNRWWDLSGDGPHDEGSYVLGAVAAQALARIEESP